MAGYTLQSFSGIAPKIAPKNLALELATAAQNVRLDRGRLEPFRGITESEVVGSTVESLFPYQGSWITSTDDVDYVGSILPNDVREQIFYTDEEYPKIRSGAQIFRLGIPRPASAPSIGAYTAGDDTRAYVCTYVDAWGYEGAPSDPSNVISAEDGTSVTLGLPGFPAGNHNFDINAKVRVYRVNTGDTGAVYQYVGEAGTGDVGWPNFTDSVPNSQLQEALPSEEWTGPPDDDTALHPDGPLRGLIELTNGALCGFSGNTVYFSEPYIPTAWPASYRISGQEQIVGLAETSQGIIVGTTGVPWLLVGAHPEAMSRVELPIVQACSSKNSLVDMGDYALYASPDGLVSLSGNDATLVTDEYFSKDEWQQYSPDTIRAFRHEEKYYAFYGATANGTGFCFDPRGGKNAFVELTGFEISRGYSDPETGEAYVIYDEGGARKIGSFETGAELEYTWKSKEFVSPNYQMFSVARVEATVYPVTLRVIGDGYDVDTIVFYDDKPVRLPTSDRARVWQFEVTGKGRVIYFGCWDAMAEVV